MSLPKVSIITVSYNAEQFIERTIQSVQAQTYTNIEYLVIDGASKDGTMNIVKRYQSAVSVLVSERDKSLYDAMNKGILRATGDYIWFMNAGDKIAAPDTLEKAIAGAGNADFIYGKTIRITEAGEEFPWHKQHPNADTLTWKSFGEGMVVCHQSMLIRRSLAPLYDDTTWKHVADIDWCLKIMKQVTKVHDTGEVMSLFLEGGYSNQTKRASLMERFRVVRTHLGFLGAVGAHLRILGRRLIG